MKLTELKHKLIATFFIILCAQAVQTQANTYDDLITKLSTNTYTGEVYNTTFNAAINAFRALPTKERQSYGYAIAFSNGTLNLNAALQSLQDKLMAPIIRLYPISPQNPVTDLGISVLAKNFLVQTLRPLLYSLPTYA